MVVIRGKDVDKTNYLVHHGAKGQKWGVKNGPPYPIHKKRVKRSAIVLTDCRLSYEEYTHVIHEIMTHATKEQREADAFSKPIGPYTYYFENNHDGTFRVVGKRKIVDRMKEYWDDED